MGNATMAIDSGSTAWMLTSSALVLLMVPGLALFYGGMVHRKNVLTTMMMSFVAMAVIGVQWFAIGYSLAFGKSLGGFIGWEPSLMGLRGINPMQLWGDKAIPELVFVMFQGKFAIITPALISGAIAERMRFRTYIVFILLWTTFIYCPLAHWVWAPGGWLCKMGVLDFAGGTVVHIAAGVSALVLALLMGARHTYREGVPHIPNNLVLTLTGAGLLWFGWFGFNAGSAVAAVSPAAGTLAGLAFTNTQVAAAAAGLCWMLVEHWTHGKVTSVGLTSGMVAGLVAITPAAGHVGPLSALCIGAVAAVFCYIAVCLKGKLGYDDSLDAFGIHGIGGMVGAILVGVFCFTPEKGLIYGNVAQFLKQLLSVGVTIGFAGGATLILGLILKAIYGLRISDQVEREGLDLHIHGERGYHLEQVQ